MSDVQHVSVESEGLYHLTLALNLLMEWPRESMELGFRVKPGTVSHWKVENGSMFFGWHESMKGAVPLPTKMTAEQVAPLILGWLKDAEYGREPDHDGSNHRGFRIRNTAMFKDYEGYYHDPYVTFRVDPAWIEYGK